MFWSQVLATVVAGTTQLGVQAWMFTNIPDMCTPKQKDGFTCPNTEVFGTASIIWGVIGPQRQFSSGQIYKFVSSSKLSTRFLMHVVCSVLLYFFLIGAIAPIIPYVFTKKYPNSFWKYVK